MHIVTLFKLNLIFTTGPFYYSPYFYNTKYLLDDIFFSRKYNLLGFTV